MFTCEYLCLMESLLFCLPIRDSQVPDSEAVSEGNGKVCICMNVCIYVSMEIYSPLPLPLP